MFGQWADTRDALLGNARQCERDTGWDRPNGYGLGPVIQHRDSDTMTRSNFRVILADLRGIDDRVSVDSFGHWDHGWLEQIVVPMTNDIVEAVAKWVETLDQCGIADEDDWSELEHAEAMEWYDAECPTWVDIEALAQACSDAGDYLPTTEDALLDRGELAQHAWAAFRDDDYRVVKLAGINTELLAGWSIEESLASTVDDIEWAGVATDDEIRDTFARLARRLTEWRAIELGQLVLELA